MNLNDIQINIDEQRIATLTLKSNDDNSVSLVTMRDLDAALSYLSQQPLIALIIDSDKNTVFSQGLNIKSMWALDNEETNEFINLFFSNLENIFRFPVPVIACISGHAMGYGAMIAIHSDYRIMIEQARIGLIETKIAMTVNPLAAAVLQDILGIKEANQHILEGGAYKAPAALEVGLLDAIYSVENIKSEALKIAKKFKLVSRSALISCKEAIRLRYDFDKLRTLGITETKKILETDDFKEFMDSMKNNRRPNFKF